MEEDQVEVKTYCCCCCKRPKKDNRPDSEEGRLNGQKPSSYEVSPPTEGDTHAESKSFPTVEQVNQNKSKECAKRCIKCCKKFTTFLFSNIGLCSAVVAYSILGGFIFQHLEAPFELLKRHHVNDRRRAYVEEIFNMTKGMKYFHKPNYSREAEEILIKFQNELLEAMTLGWDGSTNNDSEPQWSFPGSLLYSVTVITTIGYGHIAPKTSEGRLVTIFYALFGIPLTLLCLANMGSFMGNCFRLLYKHTCRLCTWLCCPPDESFSRRKKKVPGKGKELQALNPSRSNEAMTDTNKLQVAPCSSKSASRAGSSTDINIIIGNIEETKVKERVEDIRVPSFVSLMIITLYIFGGALMFSMWEDWDYLEGSYFCFITLSTIGFGDYVPGSLSRTDSDSSRQKLIICCVYLMVGLSLIAMCFNLMQEDVRAKFLWLAIKVGLIDK